MSLVEPHVARAILLSCILDFFSPIGRHPAIPRAAVVSPDEENHVWTHCRRSTLGDGAIDGSLDRAVSLRARLALVVGRAGHDALVEVGSAEDGHPIVWRVADAWKGFMSAFDSR